MPASSPQPEWPDNSDLQAAMARFNLITDSEDRYDLAYHLVVNGRELLIPIRFPNGSPEVMELVTLYQWPESTVLHVYTAPELVPALPEGAAAVPYAYLSLLDLCKEENIGTMLIDYDQAHCIMVHFEEGQPSLHSWKRFKEALALMEGGTGPA